MSKCNDRLIIDIFCDAKYDRAVLCTYPSGHGGRHGCHTRGGKDGEIDIYVSWGEIDIYVSWKVAARIQLEGYFCSRCHEHFSECQCKKENKK